MNNIMNHDLNDDYWTLYQKKKKEYTQNIHKNIKYKIFWNMKQVSRNLKGLKLCGTFCLQ